MSSILIPAATAAPSLDAARTTLSELQGALANMPDRRDVPNTERQLTLHDARQRSLDLTISRLRNAVNRVPTLTATRDNVATWIRNITAWRDEFATRLAALPPPSLESSRDVEQERASLTLSIRNIEEGTEHWNGRAAIGRALRERIQATYPARWGANADPWDSGFGSLPSATDHLRLAEAELADVQQQLDAAMRDAATLLSTT